MPTSRRLVLLACFIVSCASCGRCSAPASDANANRPAATTENATTPASGDLGADSRSVNEQLRVRLQAGPDPMAAAQLFSIEVTPLPGITPPAGRREPILDGGFAAIQLLAVLGSLTDAQQEAAAPFLGLAPFSAAQRNLPAFSRTPMTLPPLLRRAARLDPPAPRLRLAGFTLEPPPSEDDLLRAYFTPMFGWANRSIAQLLGRNPLPDTFDLTFFSDSTEAYALTTDFAIQCVKLWSVNCREDNPNRPGEKQSGAYSDLEKRLENCHTALNIAKFGGLSNEVALSIVTHEVFHCYQMKSIASLKQAQQIKQWLHDGEATWVQNVIVPEAVFPRMTDIWREYFSSPKGHLYDRGYPAFPFFGHVSDVAGTDFVAKSLLDAFVRGLNSNDDAFSTIVGEQEDRILDTWASSYFLAHHDKFLWDARGPGNRSNIPGSVAAPAGVTVGTGSVTLPEAAKWELSLVRLDAAADIVEVTMDAGHMSLIDASEAMNVKFIDGEPIRFCTLEKCVCPQDSEGDVPPTIPARAPFDIGLTAGRQRAAAHARGYSLNDYCKRREPPPPGGGGGGKASDEPGGWNPPASWEPPSGKASSDPHIATIDGRWFDLQAIGEFTLSRSTVDDFLVQVRFGTRSTERVWSTPVALATHAGRDRIVVSLNLAAAEPIPVLRVNGRVSEADAVTLDKAVVRRISTEWGPGYVVTFADGTRVGASLTSRDGLSTWVNPAPSRRGKLTGLIGDADGNRDNDPVARGGKVLSENPDHDELYTTFGDSWRIAQADSLFDYADGESTATFTDRTYPERDRPAASPGAMTAATELCRDNGVADPDLLRNCTFDVAATGRKRYVTTYASSQRRIDYAARFTGSSATTLTGNGVVTRTTSVGATRDIVLEGRVTDAKQPAEAHFTGGRGDIVYFDPRNCVDLRFTTLNGPNDRKLAASNYSATIGLCGSRFVLPTDGSYTLVLNPFSDLTGDYRYPIVAVRPDRVRDIAIGDTMAGTINARAERDVFVLTVRGQTTISLDTNGCSGNFDIVLTYGDDETIGAGSLCRFGPTVLPKAGSYRFVVNAFNNVTGDYRVRIKQE